MFGLFKTVTIEHPVLGTLTRRRREWTGEISLVPDQAISLEIEGGKDGPNPAALAVALQLPARLPALQPVMSRALLDHLKPYQDALAEPESGYAEMLEDPDDAAKIAAIRSPEDAWRAASITGIEIGMERGAVRLLIAMRAIWDIEHTLGAYFDDWEFMELNGSI